MENPGPRFWPGLRKRIRPGPEDGRSGSMAGGQAARDVNGLTARDRHVDRRFYGGLATASERAISVEIDAELIEPALAARPGKRRPKNGPLQRRASAAVAAPGGVPTCAAASSEGDIGFCAVSSW